MKNFDHPIIPRNFRKFAPSNDFIDRHDVFGLKGINPNPGAGFSGYEPPINSQETVTVDSKSNTNATLVSSVQEDLSVVVPQVFNEIINNPNIKIADILKFNQIIKSNQNELSKLHTVKGLPLPMHFIFYSKQNNGTFPYLRFLSESDWAKKDTPLSDVVYNIDNDLYKYDVIAAGKQAAPLVNQAPSSEAANSNVLKSAQVNSVSNLPSGNTGFLNEIKNLGDKGILIVVVVVVVLIAIIAFFIKK